MGTQLRTESSMGLVSFAVLTPLDTFASPAPNPFSPGLLSTGFSQATKWSAGATYRGSMACG